MTKYQILLQSKCFQVLLLFLSFEEWLNSIIIKRMYIDRYRKSRFQQYLNDELPEVQAGFRKGKGTSDQIVNIHCIIEQAREFQKNIYFCFLDYAKAFDCVDHSKLWKILRVCNNRPPHLPPEISVCRSRGNN